MIVNEKRASSAVTTLGRRHLFRFLPTAADHPSPSACCFPSCLARAFYPASVVRSLARPPNCPGLAEHFEESLRIGIAWEVSNAEVVQHRDTLYPRNSCAHARSRETSATNRLVNI